MHPSVKDYTVLADGAFQVGSSCHCPSLAKKWPTFCSLLPVTQDQFSFSAWHEMFLCVQHPDLVRMESLVLHQLDFRVTTPTSYIFLSLYRQGIPLSNTAAALASYYTVIPLSSSIPSPLHNSHKEDCIFQLCREAVWATLKLLGCHILISHQC